ncbi:uncharacterized protein GGS22DRAFT_193237 [Annulohypoxylon maeteangense]|uniref:uncharacterized protein n=1 Tax=Annulohypoxylon maeteangense TaxID=1927788 RepID=UPI00200792C4|nr:uncharacterized protein GGS22DRAFT_193237 [Annulohypoxylon maeteangense]KAI0880466.1 hypothetical protein GGS22DRAFT_193237 [Annulohypoxylon maeteangense]
MPRLHTLACQPMHPCRLLTKSPTAYPITAQLLSAGLGSIGSNITQSAHALLHLGLRMPSFPQHPKFGLTRFYYADTNGHSALPNIGLKYLPTLFPELTHLDLCISMTKTRQDLHQLRDFIMAAKGLTHLRLCFERSYITKHETGPLFDGSYVVLSHPTFHLPRLHYLHITDTRISHRRLIRLVKRHAKTLRFLRADENMPPGIIITFVNMILSNEIKLDDLIIIPSNVEDSVFILFDDSFKNSDILQNRTLEEYIAVSKFAYVRGRQLGYGIDTWRTAAILDSRRLTALVDYADDFELLDEENGDWRDRHGLVFHADPDNDVIPNPEQDPIEARELASHIKRLRESPWWV